VSERPELGDAREWLEADGLGGFASGTASGLRTRRYHGLLCAARTPPTGRALLVAAVEAWVDLGRGPRALTSHRYDPGVTHPDGVARLAAFTPEPWPTWTYELEDGARVVHELFVPRDAAEVVLRWRLEGAPRGTLTLRPLLAARDAHALRREGAGFDLSTRLEGASVRWRPDPAWPGIVARASGRFRHEPLWYRSFLYEVERARGYDHVEDLGAPGVFEHDFARGPAGLVLAAELGEAPVLPLFDGAPLDVGDLFERERERRVRTSALERAAEAYLVRRGRGRSLIAGYPWFTDWGRDTFIALRGLLLARGETRAAADILLAWAEHVSEGMLPNRFPDQGDAPEFNSVDASLWFVVAVEETLGAARELAPAEQRQLEAAVRAILSGYAGGTRFGIRADEDGLLACGEPGLQLTWMDAKVGDEVMTPRVGKPVEIQALWLRALAFGGRYGRRLRALGERAARAFEPRFWSDEHGYLHDVVDCDHVRGAVDASLRPNQVFALGGLGPSLVAPGRTRAALDVLEAELVTPLGLRTLAPSDARYRGRYAGAPLERDRAYHQGTAWPWLTGPFVEAWVRDRGAGDEAKAAARERFLAPLRAHLDLAGLGHLSEVADGDAPHTPGGCPFQAWSLGEYLRLERRVLAPSAEPARRS